MCETGTPRQGKIYAAMADIMAAVEAVEKKRSAAGGLNYAFRSIDDVMAEVNRHLKTARVFAVPEIVSENAIERQTKNGGVMLHRLVTVKYHFTADDGSYITATGAGEAMDSGDKATSKAMAMAFKYVLTQMFCIPTEGDNDPDATVHEIKGGNSRSEHRPSEKLPEKKTGKLPLTSQLYAVSQSLKLTNNDIDLTTRQALGIADGAIPRLVDIKEPANQKKVLAYLIKYASEKYVATGVLNEFLAERGCETVSDFVKKNSAEISDIEALFERMAAKKETSPLPPTPTTDQLITAYKDRGVSLKEMEAAVQKSVQYWTPEDRDIFSRAYREAQTGKHETIGAALAAILN